MPATMHLYRRLTHKYRAGWSDLDEHEWVADATVLFSQSQDVDDPEDYCDARMSVMILHVDGEHEPAKICEAIADSYSGTSCTHEHDCCGCYHSSARGHHLGGPEYLVRISSSRNY